MTRETLVLPDGRALSALRHGAGVVRTVFVHGAGLNAHTWDRTVVDLGEPALAVDLPGHGDSGWRDDADYEPRTLAPDVARAIEAWATPPVSLVGHSLGGLTTIHLAAARPDLVSRLTLVDTVPGAGGPGASRLTPFYERIEFDSIEDALDHALAFGLGGDRERARRGVILNTRTRDDGVVEWKHHMARLLSPSVPDRLARAIDAGAAWTALHDVAAPVSLIAGSRGYLSDADLSAFREARPEAAVTVLDAPHNVQETSSADLARLVSAASA